MKEVRIVYIGNFAVPENGQAHSLKSFARFFNGLANDASNPKVSIFAGSIHPGEVGFEFSCESPLDPKIQLTLSKGNTPTTSLVPFLLNNLRLFVKLTRYSLKKSDYFVFLPAPIGAWSVLVTTLFRRNKSLGVYIGGYYKKEQASEFRKGWLKQKIKKLGAEIVERLVDRAIRKADYIITPSYEIQERLRASAKVFLTPPMMNVTEADLSFVTPPADDKFISFCGELRHAKGVVDLMQAYIQGVAENRLGDHKLKIIGSGQALEELKELAQQGGVADRVVFTGQIKEEEVLKKELGSSSFFVLPSYSEGFPRVAYECFTLNVPTILTPVGGVPYLVKDRVHTLLVEPGNVSQLLGAMESLVRDEALKNSLAANAKELMRTNLFPRIRKDVSLNRMVLQKIEEVKEKTSLVVVTHSYYPAVGGVETFVADLLSKLDNSKYKIQVFTSDKFIKGGPRTFQKDGVDITVMPSLHLAGFIFPLPGKQFWKLFNALRKADVVHHHDLKFMANTLSFLSILFRYRLLLFSHGYVYHSERFKKIKTLFLRYFSFLSRWYAAVVNISENDYEISKRFGFRNAVLLRERTNLSRFINNPKDQQAGIYLYYGRIARNKGIENLLRCLSHVDHSFQLIIAGAGEEEYLQELKAKATQYGLSDQITWTSRLSDEALLKELSRAEIVFLPSLYEGFGITLLEAIASKSKVLAHNNNSYALILQELEGEDFIFDFSQPEQFPTKLKAVLETEVPLWKHIHRFNHDEMVKEVEKLSNAV
ncbi:glycosyltransferase [Flavihumibacter sp. RY-1]|uniref:Glycosyltransferase n=1 Tax=Flavihumibacter fluminis TaxID=2909236 RepID=A0ABS9BJS1_9BACT|nr:glycosyltransferase [Flavihumibacter fluminis]MCF1715268.1 glycosyltransferase [Flavihumibacter fluminis]